MALAVLTALTGARTPIVWFKVCPVLLATSAAFLLLAQHSVTARRPIMVPSSLPLGCWPSRHHPASHRGHRIPSGQQRRLIRQPSVIADSEPVVTGVQFHRARVDWALRRASSVGPIRLYRGRARPPHGSYAPDVSGVSLSLGSTSEEPRTDALNIHGQGDDPGGNRGGLLPS